MSTGARQPWHREAVDTCTYSTNTLKFIPCSSAIPLTLIRNSSLDIEGDMTRSFASKLRYEDTWKYWFWMMLCWDEERSVPIFISRFYSCLFCKSLSHPLQIFILILSLQSALWPRSPFFLSMTVLQVLREYRKYMKPMTSLYRAMHSLLIIQDAFYSSKGICRFFKFNWYAIVMN